ncbi:MAG: hypothetical protein AAFR79_03500 [Pseudomonadota bacterium]
MANSEHSQPVSTMAGSKIPDPFGFSEAVTDGGFGALAAVWMAPWRAGAVVAEEAMRGGFMGWYGR